MANNLGCFIMYAYFCNLNVVQIPHFNKSQSPPSEAIFLVLNKFIYMNFDTSDLYMSDKFLLLFCIFI